MKIYENFLVERINNLRVQQQALLTFSNVPALKWQDLQTYRHKKK
jgi:hypothetical protein